MLYSGEIFSNDEDNIAKYKKIISTTKNDSLKVKAIVNWDNLIYTSDSELDQKLNLQLASICLKNINQKNIGEKTKTYYTNLYAQSLNNLSLINIEKSELYKAI